MKPSTTTSATTTAISSSTWIGTQPEIPQPTGTPAQLRETLSKFDRSEELARLIRALRTPLIRTLARECLGYLTEYSGGRETAEGLAEYAERS